MQRQVPGGAPEGEPGAAGGRWIVLTGPDQSLLSEVSPMPSVFASQIAGAQPSRDQIKSRRWVYVPYDQLTAEAGPLQGADPGEVGLVLVESREKARRRPYHKKKLAFVLTNERHFALEQASRGFKVLYLAGEAGFAAQLEAAVAQHGLSELEVMRPAERELRAELAASRLPLRFADNALFLTRAEDLRAAAPGGPPYRMDAFYRQVRRRLGVLLYRGKPAGGRFSFDGENRKPWRGEPPPPPRFSVPPDELTQEVLARVEDTFPEAFGTLQGFDLPASAADAEAMWRHVKTHCLPHFGPYEDAISLDHPDLFHSRLSAVINVGRLLPGRIVAETEGLFRAGRLPLPSAEGFIRQILGWREFVRHVHDATDGFRSLDPAAAPSALLAREPLPAVYWGAAPSGLHCLDQVVAGVQREGFSHHITRLMVLSNIATLLGISPRELCDWFWVAYIDAFDWVVEPNVLAMGTYGDGGLMTTKPYVAGAAYLHKMGDACGRCQFEPSGKGASACPLTPMYWAFLHRNRERLAENDRMKLPLAAAARREPAQKAHDTAVAEAVRGTLRSGGRLPADLVGSLARPARAGADPLV